MYVLLYRVEDGVHVLAKEDEDVDSTDAEIWLAVSIVVAIGRKSSVPVPSIASMKAKCSLVSLNEKVWLWEKLPLKGQRGVLKKECVCF